MVNPAEMALFVCAKLDFTERTNKRFCPPAQGFQPPSTPEVPRSRAKTGENGHSRKTSEIPSPPCPPAPDLRRAGLLPPVQGWRPARLGNPRRVQLPGLRQLVQVPLLQARRLPPVPVPAQPGLGGPGHAGSVRRLQRHGSDPAHGRRQLPLQRHLPRRVLLHQRVPGPLREEAEAPDLRAQRERLRRRPVVRRRPQRAGRHLPVLLQRVRVDPGRAVLLLSARGAAPSAGRSGDRGGDGRRPPRVRRLHVRSRNSANNTVEHY